MMRMCIWIGWPFYCAGDCIVVRKSSKSTIIFRCLWPQSIGRRISSPSIFQMLLIYTIINGIFTYLPAHAICALLLNLVQIAHMSGQHTRALYHTVNHIYKWSKNWGEDAFISAQRSWSPSEWCGFCSICVYVCVCGNKKSRAHPSIHPAEFQSKIKRMWVPVLCRYCYRNNIMIMICGCVCVCAWVCGAVGHTFNIYYICKSDISMLGWEGNHYILRIVSEGRVHQVCALHVCVVVTR